MTTLLPLLAETRMNSLFWTLAWAFLVAALLWLLVWRLLRSRSDGGAAAPASAEAPPAEKPAEPANAVLSEPPVVDPVAESAGEADLPEIETATPEQAAAQFRHELDSGAARQDEAFGIVYQAPPDTRDDLKKIRGIAKVLEGRLHEHGVFQYRQIAYWTAPAVREFTKLLPNFTERIYRDNGIAPARELHEEKYGEKLP